MELEVMHVRGIICNIKYSASQRRGKLSLVPFGEMIINALYQFLKKILYCCSTVKRGFGNLCQRAKGEIVQKSQTFNSRWT